ncbi:MAG: alpha,alpha-trehalase TreF [Gammaproteobacteria bacterium]|nr:alpha,alpha-trehalase TreF [Gammaproteobacteria bacterium]MDH5304310.1 alpha,alpha-trehalase TreF [Gammaproteobacteria bacterium]MDH5322585.1 alpha,alpha-trehalase TreF [Gammaproteobacteria bacterium]
MIQVKGPEEIYGELFALVQKRRVFRDSKTFVDAVPRRDVATILAEFAALHTRSNDQIRLFVEQNFELPTSYDDVSASKILPLDERLEQLWGSLSRGADHVVPDSSLIELPRPYIVPGGRFREVYYWDSYFTMLGLAESRRFDMIEDMVENFAYLIDHIGFIPNGTRSYFCSRSQPPFFVLMVELLAEVRGDTSIVYRYLPQLQREYAFWMAGADTLSADGSASRRVVRIGDGFLNRYWDDSDTPRAESYAEDLEHAAKSGRDSREYYRNIRAACESGWDFSSRWLQEPGRLESIVTTTVLPLDLNAMLYRLESCLAEVSADEVRAKQYRDAAAFRKEQLQGRFFDRGKGFFFDLRLDDLQPTATWSLAAAYPLYLGIATEAQAAQVVAAIQSRFLAAGGWLTTLTRSGQQWDRPNGWAPLQWIVYRGFCDYGFDTEARAGAGRWVANNIRVYESTGRLFEKYDLERVEALASGGEYSVQDGFGWTNGVLLKLMHELGDSYQG